MSLENFTRDRPKPPSQRRPPTKYRTPSPSPNPSPVHTNQPSQTPASMHQMAGTAAAAGSAVERIGGITDVVEEERANLQHHQQSNTNGAATKSEVSLKEQWVCWHINFKHAQG